MMDVRSQLALLGLSAAASKISTYWSGATTGKHAKARQLRAKAKQTKRKERAR